MSNSTIPPGIWDNPTPDDQAAYDDFVKAWNQEPPPPKPAPRPAPFLTIGFSTRNDQLAWMTVNALLTYFPHLLDRIEILVIDNSPKGTPHQVELQKHLRGSVVRYIHVDGPESSCLYKDRVFHEARGKYVLQCDSHVLFDPGSLEALIAYYEAHPETGDLIMGPCLNRGGNVVGTNQILFADDPHAKIPKDATVHHGVICRGGQLGVWTVDPRGTDPAGEPFEISQQGTGVFSCRRDAWPGFHSAFRGFGGNETYLMESFRNRGDKVLCLPALRWVHSWYRPGGAPYSVNWTDRIRNYIVGFSAIESTGGPRAETAKQLRDAAIAHFSKQNPQSTRTAQKQADAILGGWSVDDVTSVTKSAEKPALQPATLYQQSLNKLSVGPGGAIPQTLFQYLEGKIAERQQQPDAKPLKTLEFGAGASTLLFDALGTDHLCVEHKQAWVDKVRPHLTSENTKVVFAPLKAPATQDGHTWYNWTPPRGVLYDLIVIDGPPGYNAQQPGRLGAVGVVEKLLAPGGTIIVEDAHRQAERQLAGQLAKPLGLTPRLHKQGNRAWIALEPPAEPLGEGPGTELVEMFDKAGFPKCQLCVALARRMNGWGPTGCRERMDEIVSDMMPRAKAWLKAERPWAQKLLGAVWAEDAVLKGEIRKNVNKAIAAYERKLASKEPAA